jgi:hypothetical protein
VKVSLSFALSNNARLLKEVLRKSGTQHFAKEPELDREVLAKPTRVVVDDCVRVAKRFQQRVHLQGSVRVRACGWAGKQRGLGQKKPWRRLDT